MTLKAQIFLIAVLAVALLLVIKAVHKQVLQLKYALPWLTCGVVLIILVALPDVIDWLAELLGIQSPVNMVFFLGFVFTLAIVFLQTLVISRLNVRIRQLAQAIALLEKRESEAPEDTQGQ